MRLRRVLLLAVLAAAVVACHGPRAAPAETAPSPSPAPLIAVVPSQATSSSPTNTAVPSATEPPPTTTPEPTFTATITFTPEPAGCQAPPEDYTRVEVNGWTLNARTLWMLRRAAELYGGELEIDGYHITQGSYTSAESASFGTHAGGGAVDLSVMRKGTYTVLWDDVEPLVAALRAAGFAAWLRAYGELYPDSPIHIHAIAVGDAELSLAARDQLTGKFGYFLGYTGVPVEGDPLPDRHGGPLLCGWMADIGYAVLMEPALTDP